MHVITFVLVLLTSKQPFVMQIPAPGLLGLYGQHVQPLVEGDQLTATVITLVLENKKNKQSLVTITVVVMDCGPHGLSVRPRAMEDQNLDLDHTIAAWPMISRLLCVGVLELTHCGLNGHHVQFVTILANHQFLLNALAVIVVQLSQKLKIKLVLHRDVHTGPHGVDGAHAQLLVVPDSELVIDCAWDRMSSVLD